MKRRNLGLVQIPLIIGILIMAIVIPLATRLVQKRQETRRGATGDTCKLDVTGAENSACCCSSSDCSGGQTCTAANGYCQSGKSCEAGVAPTNTPVPGGSGGCSYGPSGTYACLSATECVKCENSETLRNQPRNLCPRDQLCYQAGGCVAGGGQCTSDNCCPGYYCYWAAPGEPSGVCALRDSCQSANNRPVGCSCDNASQCMSKWCEEGKCKAETTPVPTATPTNAAGCKTERDLCSGVGQGNCCSGFVCMDKPGAFTAQKWCVAAPTPTGPRPTATPTDVCYCHSAGEFMGKCSNECAGVHSGATCAWNYECFDIPTNTPRPTSTPTSPIGTNTPTATPRPCDKTTGRPNGCPCDNDAKCASYYCNPQDRVCGPEPTLQPTRTPTRPVTTNTPVGPTNTVRPGAPTNTPVAPTNTQAPGAPTATRTVTPTPQYLLNIDWPQEGISLGGTTVVSGWAAERYVGPLSKVEFYMDLPKCNAGQTTGCVGKCGEVSIGVSRPDLRNLDGGKYINSGYQWGLNTSSLNVGPHAIYVYGLKGTSYVVGPVTRNFVVLASPTPTVTPVLTPLVCPFYGELSVLTVGATGSISYSFKYEIKNTTITDARLRYGGNCWARKKVGETWQAWTGIGSISVGSTTPRTRQTKTCSYTIPVEERNLQWEFGGGVSVWYDMDNSGWSVTEADMPTKKTCSVSGSTNCSCVADKLSYPLSTPTLTPTATVTGVPPTATTTQSVGPDAYLSFKMTYYGIIPDPKCSTTWKLKVMVKKGSLTKVFDNIVPVRDTNVTNKAVYKVQGLRLVGFPETEGVGVFIKGVPKHLQVKYAVADQEGFYNLPGGELELTTNAQTTPIYDFTAYPLLAGDVTGAEETQDGIIDGRDFAEVKALAMERNSGDEGTDVEGDLDGSCVATSNDWGVLLHSLNEIYEQLY